LFAPAPPLPRNLYAAVLGYCDAKTLLRGCWYVSKGVHELCWAAARGRLFLVTHGSAVELRDIWTGELVGKKEVHKSTISCMQVVVVSGEDQLITCADQDRVKVWHLPSMRLLREWKQKSVTAVSVDVASNTIALGVRGDQGASIRPLPRVWRRLAPYCDQGVSSFERACAACVARGSHCGRGRFLSVVL
jgi:hypothetical protein